LRRLRPRRGATAPTAPRMATATGCFHCLAVVARRLPVCRVTGAQRRERRERRCESRRSWFHSTVRPWRRRR
jgi:hypothetical protein